MSSIENALRILALLDPNRPVLRVGEVCRELDIPKSSVSRLLKTLSDYGMVERRSGEAGYVAGARAVLLADLYASQHTLKDQAEVSLGRLTEEFGFAGYVSVLNGPDIIIVSTQHGSYPLRLVREIGKPMTALSTSVGRALMMHLDDDEIIHRARIHGSDDLSKEDILHRVEVVREFGVAWGKSAFIPGIAALAVSVHDPKKGESIGFSISYPTSAVDPDLQARMVQRLREEALSIGRRIGDPYWEKQVLQKWPLPDFAILELPE